MIFRWAALILHPPGVHPAENTPRRGKYSLENTPPLERTPCGKYPPPPVENKVGRCLDFYLKPLRVWTRSQSVTEELAKRLLYLAVCLALATVQKLLPEICHNRKGRSHWPWNADTMFDPLNFSRTGTPLSGGTS